MNSASLHTIYPVDQERIFTEDEAYRLVDLLLIVTSKSKNKINGHNTQIEMLKNYPEKSDQAHLELNAEIQKWSDKVRRIGATPLALFEVKIKAERGFFEWKYPSANLEHIPS